eukprot:1209689-Rhodomonas_salina.2
MPVVVSFLPRNLFVHSCKCSCLHTRVASYANSLYLGVKGCNSSRKGCLPLPGTYSKRCYFRTRASQATSFKHAEVGFFTTRVKAKKVDKGFVLAGSCSDSYFHSTNLVPELAVFFV